MAVVYLFRGSNMAVVYLFKGSNMAIVSLFRGSNMAAVTSSENQEYMQQQFICSSNNKIDYNTRWFKFAVLWL